MSRMPPELSPAVAEEQARAALDALPGLRWNAWTAGALPDVSRMLTEVERVDEPSERHSLDELREDFGSPTMHLERDALLARDETGEVVAIARALCTDHDREVRRVVLAGEVRPDWRGRGVGRAVMTWQLAHARQWYAAHHLPEHGPLRLSVFSDGKKADEHRLAERVGLSRSRYYAELTRSFGAGEAIEVPPLEGLEIRPWRTSTPEETLAVRNACFRDHWGSVDRPMQSWMASLEAKAFRPEWSFVAVDRSSGEIAGFLMSSAYEQDWEPQGYRSGYVELLGTLRPYRGRGIATALILSAMRAFLDDGMEAAEIGVDAENPTGAFGLYTGLGFAETSGTVQFMREEGLPG
ncbi:MAG: GNAT family N-acetyltransferase [Intrasporangium sp.]|uniref:GNAT family N-acetyltransferase n=1 Tax=Intrasporangium sp. TaxID=1925024 RepID=UPI003F807B18